VRVPFRERLFFLVAACPRWVIDSRKLENNLTFLASSDKATPTDEKAASGFKSLVCT
jgi:hypothetical protein